MEDVETKESMGNRSEESKEPYLLISHSIDEILTIVGEYGRFQKILNLVFCVGLLPTTYPLVLTYFASSKPTWKCIANSTDCPLQNMTFSSDDNFRCTLQRDDWEYTVPRDYSIVTSFDLVCDKAYLIDLSTSILFFGFMFGAVILGWCADTFGRKIVHFISVAVVIILGFLSIFMTDIYLFIASRFIIGFFLHGTFPQVFLMISEIVGNRDRAFCNTTFVIAVGVALPLLALKAYFIQKWKILFVVCTLPYIFILLTFKFVPESVRYLRVKGKLDEAMVVFRQISDWNNKELPHNVAITPVTTDQTIQNTNPFVLFRTAKMAATTIVLSFSSLTISMANYCLIFAAGDISGHIYRDFVITNLVRIPVGLVTPYFLNRFGRKKITRLYVLIGSVSCIALAFTPKSGGMKILRVVLGMSGIACMCGAGLARQVWELELYPTHIRGEGTGFGQLLNKFGATTSAWIDNDANLSRLFTGGPFIIIGVLNFVSLCLQTCLPETKDVITADTETELENRNGTEPIEGGNAKVHAYTNEMYDVTETGEKSERK